MIYIFNVTRYNIDHSFSISIGEPFCCTLILGDNRLVVRTLVHKKKPTWIWLISIHYVCWDQRRKRQHVILFWCCSLTFSGISMFPQRKLTRLWPPLIIPFWPIKRSCLISINIGRRQWNQSSSQSNRALLAYGTFCLHSCLMCFQVGNSRRVRWTGSL